ncbi:MAG: hypothetical protein K8I60_05565, partial [Anaerolineae bacterium]|nr:hypothetical protein [Anaerolineae bacterium]
MSTQTAGTAAAQPKRPKKNTKPRGIRRFGQLFFIKRFPKFFGGDPEDWSQPEDDAEYQKHIDREGFVSAAHWKEDDLTQHPVVLQDIKDLEQHLLPIFFSFGQKARHYQNQ